MHRRAGGDAALMGAAVCQRTKAPTLATMRGSKRIAGRGAASVMSRYRAHRMHGGSSVWLKMVPSAVYGPADRGLNGRAASGWGARSIRIGSCIWRAPGWQISTISANHDETFQW